jgi:hypothetical protein
MRLIHELLDYSKPWSLPHIYLFTGNPVRRADFGLVMGRGAAKQVRDSWPGIDKKIRTRRPVDFTKIQPDQWIGWFQVKRHWRDPADLELIRASAEMLTSIASLNSHIFFHLNAPGIGNGRLFWSDVEPILEPLPDNVLIYK